MLSLFCHFQAYMRVRAITSWLHDILSHTEYSFSYILFFHKRFLFFFISPKDVQYPEKDKKMVQEVFDLKDERSKLSCNTYQQVHLDMCYQYIYAVILNYILFLFYLLFSWNIY